MEFGAQKERSFHLAGIIPVAGKRLDFEMPWHDCMMPLAPNYLAIERSVVECAYAGCETIWLVCSDDIQPLIKHKIGDYIYDPVWFNRDKFNPRPKNEKKEIPIFYVPNHPKDRGKIDCLSWSALYGSLTAYHISKQISKWVIPDKYYVSFPYGVYDPKKIRKHRKQISSRFSFFLRHNGKTVKNGEYLGFTFDAADFLKFRKVIRSGTGKYTASKKEEKAEFEFTKETLPVDERWSARNFHLDDVFGSLPIPQDSNFLDIDWYYNIDSWNGYLSFLSAEESQLIKRPSKKILSPRKFNKIIDTS